MRATVAFPCAQCQAGLEVELPLAGGKAEGAAAGTATAAGAAAGAPAGETVAACRCGREVALHPDSIDQGKVVGCPACGGKLLYRQKDFRQAIGCVVVVIAAVLAPFTWYASLGVAALIDLLLYRLSGEVVICYRIPCKAHVRGVPPGPKVGAFDLSIHDYHRMLARREAQGLTGPDDTTGPPLDARSHP